MAGCRCPAHGASWTAAAPTPLGLLRERVGRLDCGPGAPGLGLGRAERFSTRPKAGALSRLGVSPFLRARAKNWGRSDLYLLVDNYATHKHPKVKTWLKRPPRFHMHFAPTSSSWLNLVERGFREIPDSRIRRGVFHSVKQLIAAIDAHIKDHNENPRSFVWTAKAEAILEKVRRAWAVLAKMQTV